MKFEMNLKIEKPRYFTVSDITYAQVDAWFVATLKLIQCNNAPDTPLTMNTPPC